MGVSVPGVLPSVGKAFMQVFPAAQELSAEFAERLISTFNAALQEDAAIQNPDVAANRQFCTFITQKDLKTWIDANRGKWITQVWVG